MSYEFIIAGLLGALLAAGINWFANLRLEKDRKRHEMKNYAYMQFLQIAEKIFEERFRCYDYNREGLNDYFVQFNFCMDYLKVVASSDGIGKAEDIKRFLEKEYERVKNATKFPKTDNPKVMELVLQKYDEMLQEEEYTYDYMQKISSQEYRERIVQSALRKCWKTIYNGTSFSGEKEDEAFDRVTEAVKTAVENRLKMAEENKRTEDESNRRLRQLINEFVHYIRDDSEKK